MSLRRILNELHNAVPNKLLNTELYDNFSFVEIGNHIICREIGVINNKSGVIELKFNIDDNYPFKPPKVFIAGMREDIFYLSWLSKIVNYNNPNISSIQEINHNAWIFSIIKWPLLKKYLKYPGKGICYCCESIICTNQWSPRELLCNILFEYIISKQFLIYSSNLNQRQINNIFKNEKWNIPNDIIEHIIEFL